MELKFLLLLAISFHLSLSQDAKYCDPKYCTNGSPHISCPGNAPRQCPADVVEITMTNDLKNFILTKHNSYRNSLAGGNITGFPTALQMPVIQWDNDLAFNAKSNAMRCVFAHDKCRNTDKFKWAGQNIARTQGYPTDMAHLIYALDGWWEEYKDASVNDINKYKSTTKMIGHFTAMSQDRTDRVGCAATRYNSNTRYIVCNYSFTNLYQSYVYKTGPTASGCKTGKHSVYKNLCSQNEVVNPNP